MKPFCVVELKVFFETWRSFRDALIAVQVDIFILHRPPQALYKDIVKGAASTVYADLDAFP